MIEQGKAKIREDGWLARCAKRGDVVITQDSDLGVRGRVGGFTFDATVFAVGSDYGIDQGRVSQLRVMRKDRVILHYDRGWVEIPKSKREYDVLRKIVSHFPEKGQKAGLSANVKRGLPRDDHHDSLPRLSQRDICDFVQEPHDIAGPRRSAEQFSSLASAEMEENGPLNGPP
jgi:hypothetical protein